MISGNVEHRFVLLGASNLTLGFPRISQALTRTFPTEMELWGMHGHGRSLGARTTVGIRSLPGMLDSGLWEDLAAAPPARRTYALLTDIGNDLLYNRTPDVMLGWLSEIVSRLRDANAELVMTRLPLPSAARLTAAHYHVAKQLFFPGSGPSWIQMQRMVREVDDGMQALADAAGAKLIEPPLHWYGWDPVHIRRGARSAAWSEILSTWDGVAIPASEFHCSTAHVLKVWMLPPAERTWAGYRRGISQPCLQTETGFRLSLY